jgi:hypothetical protein
VPSSHALGISVIVHVVVTVATGEVPVLLTIVESKLRITMTTSFITFTVIALLLEACNSSAQCFLNVTSTLCDQLLCLLHVLSLVKVYDVSEQAKNVGLLSFQNLGV